MTKKTTNIKEFQYGNSTVRYDMDALEKAIKGLTYEDEEECRCAYATGMMDDGCECHIRIVDEWFGDHDDDDLDTGDDLLSIYSDEILAHCDENTPDAFIITSIGGYEADVA